MPKGPGCRSIDAHCEPSYRGDVALYAVEQDTKQQEESGEAETDAEKRATPGARSAMKRLAVTNAPAEKLRAIAQKKATRNSAITVPVLIGATLPESHPDPQ